MIKTLKFGEREISFSSALAWTFIYKAQFKRDAIKYLMPLFTSAEGTDVSEKIMDSLGFVGTVEIAWAMAKLCDNSIPDPLIWIEELGDSFDFVEVFTEIIPMVVESSGASKNQQAPTPKKGKGQK